MERLQNGISGVRFAEIFEKINKEKKVNDVIDWLEQKNINAAKNFKKIVKRKEIQSIQVYKLHPETRNLLTESPIIKYYNADKALWIENYKGGTRRRRRKTRKRSNLLPN